MSLFVKICGLTHESGAFAAQEAGADAIGFVFADSPRMVTPVVAARIASAVSDSLLKVAIFLRPTQQDIDEVLSAFEPDVVQADATSRIELPAGVGLLPVFREGGKPPGTNDPDRLILYEGRRSGVGSAVNWDVAGRLSKQARLVLAGGLTPENVGVAVRTVRPFGVDVSSGVEAAPGVADPSRIARFVSAARSSAERLRVG